jgi:hypothetical protein
MRRPLEAWAPFLLGTVAQEQVDQVLVRNSKFSGSLFEVGDGCRIEPNRDLSLEELGIGILAGRGEVVFFSQGWSRSQ